MKPTRKPPGTKRLKLEHEKLLFNFAFKFNLRRSTEAAAKRDERKAAAASPQQSPLRAPPSQRMDPGRGLHSSTSQLNLSRFCHKIHSGHHLIPPDIP